jgi:hypothetical protein
MNDPGSSVTGGTSLSSDSTSFVVPYGPLTRSSPTMWSLAAEVLVAIGALNGNGAHGG